MFKPLEIRVEIFAWESGEDWAEYRHFTTDGGFLFFRQYGNGQVAVTTNRTPMIEKAHFHGPKGFIVLPEFPQVDKPSADS